MSESSKTLPVSEYFVSPQGEGVWSGTAMFFLRLAGCTVGKPFPKDYIAGNYLDGLSQLPIYTEQCTLYDGRKFACDTDYRVKERSTPRQILEEIPKDVKHVCITGGEPMMHDLDNLYSYLWGEGKKIHLETSGTINKYVNHEVWVTCSPKFNVYLDMLKRADEIKILVDESFNIQKPIMAITDGLVQAINLRDLAQVKPVYLQPVNEENTINSDNMQRCMDIQKEFPFVRICCQLHKAISANIGELVR
jgi:7-carboxy-7-deazaguanine synthase